MGIRQHLDLLADELWACPSLPVRLHTSAGQHYGLENGSCHLSGCIFRSDQTTSFAVRRKRPMWT
ncbi:MAG: hypothetical protein ACLSHC_18710 [Bilophila wadsworthia]